VRSRALSPGVDATPSLPPPAMRLAALLLLAAPAQTQGVTLSLERIVAPGQGILQPVDVHAIPAGAVGAGDLVVAERQGLVKVVEDGLVRAEPYADLRGLVETQGDVGLRAIQFHPDHAVNGEVFVWYDADNGTAGVDGVLARMTLDGGPIPRLDPASYAEVLRVTQDGRSHGGGAIHFDQTGMLCLAIGDGHPGGDPSCRAQDPSNLLGTMIRIDVDGGTPYAVPPDNPFVGVPGYAPEVLHFGLRHPWKWSFDRLTGSTWIADVGEYVAEEVNHVPPGVTGLNFGWSVLEGSDCFAAPCPGGIATSCLDATLTAPVFEYGHALGCSVTGGAVYRGALIPELAGRYVFTDFCSKRIWTTEYDPQTQGHSTFQHPINTYPAGSSLVLAATVGTDANGELLFPDYTDGEIYRLAPRIAVSQVCTGAVNNTGSRASLSLVGGTSLGQGTLRFQVTNVPPFALGVLFLGPETVSVPLGNGVLCVGPGATGLVRVEYSVSSGTGLLLHEPSVSSGPLAMTMGLVNVGTTSYFQSWYRDVNGPLGQNTNLSSAISVRFRP